LIGATPYLLAAKYLEIEMMRALAGAGADPALALDDGTTPVMAAAGMGSAAQANRRNLTVFDGGKVEDESVVLQAVRTAVELGGDVNAASRSGDTALHVAASTGLDTVVQFLVDHGAEINPKNARGQTPLALLIAGSPRAAGGAAGGSSRPILHPTTAELLRSHGGIE
jgi:ankyrin repeat protein